MGCYVFLMLVHAFALGSEHRHAPLTDLPLSARREAWLGVRQCCCGKMGVCFQSGVDAMSLCVNACVASCLLYCPALCTSCELRQERETIQPGRGTRTFCHPRERCRAVPCRLRRDCASPLHCPDCGSPRRSARRGRSGARAVRSIRCARFPDRCGAPRSLAQVAAGWVHPHEWCWGGAGLGRAAVPTLDPSRLAAVQSLNRTGYTLHAAAEAARAHRQVTGRAPARPA